MNSLGSAFFFSNASQWQTIKKALHLKPMPWWEWHTTYILLQGDENMETIGLNLQQQKPKTRLCKVLKTFSREEINADLIGTRKCKNHGFPKD